MPYNPGVQDVSGQLLAQGIGQFAQGAAHGIDQYGRRLEENKALTSQAKALETLLPLYAKTAGVTDQEIQQFLTPSPDETARGRVGRLSSAIEGIIGNSALQTRMLNDAQVRAQTAATEQATRVSQAHQAELQRQIQDALAQRGRVRTMYGGNPSPEEIGAMLKGGSRFEDLAPGAPPPTTQAAVQKMLAAGVENPRLLVAVEKMDQMQPFTPRMVDLGGGVTAMTTSRSSAVPVSKSAPKTAAGSNGVKTIDLPGVGSMIVDAQTGEPIAGSKIVRPPSGGKLDPMLVGTLTQQIQKLEAEKLQHQQEMVQGDNRYGFLNTSSRADRIKEIDAQLSGLRATLNAGAKGSAAAAPAPAPSTAAADAASSPSERKAAPVASPYTSAEVQAELKRRGLIK